jgi:voltage-gated potassium channel Kch
VVRRLIEHGEVTRATLLGAICGYLLIPVAFFFAFLACNESSAGPFFAYPEASPSYMYFSLTTLTTVGYGDLTAVTNVGRLLASAEAVLGQVYLVTFVAMIVGLYAAARGARRAEEKSQSGP